VHGFRCYKGQSTFGKHESPVEKSRRILFEDSLCSLRTCLPILLFVFPVSHFLVDAAGEKAQSRSMLGWSATPSTHFVARTVISRDAICPRAAQAVRMQRRPRARTPVCVESPVNPVQDGQESGPPQSRRITVGRVIDLSTTMFPVWVAGGAALAAVYPPAFLWFPPKFIVLVLAVIMAGMGLTLSADDFKIAASRPWTVLLGVLAQYSIMPSLGYCLTRLLPLPADIAVGIILVAVCPGGAASNLVCLIGKADVALSVVLTLCSTMLAVVAIPTLMKLLAGTIVPISALSLMMSTGQVVVAPLLLGFTLRRVVPTFVDRAATILPLISVLGVTLICGSIVASNAGASLGSVGPVVLLALTALHGLGGLLGYVVARLFAVPMKSARTVSIEVMMQNSSLAVALALAHFSSPLTAVPGSVYYQLPPLLPPSRPSTRQC
jgi:bile acid:Na+ symporter, BASS family